MSNLTPNLELFKYDTKTDGKNTFNIDVALNNNWDKIDGAIKQIETEVNNIDISWDKIENKPDSLPANGGNADTVDGKHASDFIQTTGGTISGAGNGIAFHGKSQNNGIYATNGDSADIGVDVENNLTIKSWQGVGFVNGCTSSGVGTLNETTVSVDCRNGNIRAKGDIISNGFNLSNVNFKRLAERGFDDSQFSSTDVASNMYKIFHAIPDYSVCMDMLSASTDYPNLYASILAKAKTDLGLTKFNSNQFIIKFEKGYGTNLPNTVTLWDNGTYKEYKFIYDRDGTDNRMSKMYQTFGEGANGGDIMGKTIKHETLSVACTKNNYAVLKSYSNAKGGMARVHAMWYNTNRTIPVVKLVVDGTTVLDGVDLHSFFGRGYDGTTAHFFDIPFKSSFELYYKDTYSDTTTKVSLTYYLNQ